MTEDIAELKKYENVQRFQVIFENDVKDKIFNINDSVEDTII